MTHNYTFTCYRINKLSSCFLPVPSRNFRLLAFFLLLTQLFIFPNVALEAKPFIKSYSPQASGCLPDLVHYFPFDESASGFYQDKISKNDAECNSCPTATSSLFAGGLAFDGNESKVTFKAVSNFNWTATSSFTIEFWIKTTANASQNQVIIGRNATDSDMKWWIGISPQGYPLFEMRDKNSKGHLIGGEGVKVNDGKWHHIAVVREGTSGRNKLYVDGYTIADFGYDYTTGFESISAVDIGYLRLDNGYHYAGSLDELMVYSRALSETEMRSRYNKGAGNYCGTNQFAPTITSEAVTFGVQEQRYSYDVVATGNPTYSLVSAPQGMNINAATGEITWIPSAAGKVEVTVKAENNAGQDLQNYEIDVKKGVGEIASINHHWMFQETSGLTFKDFYTPYDAIAEDEETAPMPDIGVLSGGQRFDGQNDKLDVLNGTNFNWSNDASFSIEVWMRTKESTSGNRVLIGRQGEDSYLHWWIGADDNGHAAFQLRDIIYDGVLLDNKGPKLNDGKWHQIFAVRDGASNLNKLYVDGQQVSQSYFDYKHEFASRSNINIGYLKRAGGYHYNGTLDEIKLFSRALTDAEINDRFEETYNAITELISFGCTNTPAGVALRWETASENYTEHFAVERSADGIKFDEIGSVKAAGSSLNYIEYNFLDNNPLRGTAFYRLKIYKTGGITNYSNTVKIDNVEPVTYSFAVYPNPTIGGKVTILATNIGNSEDINVSLTDLTGRNIINETVKSNSDGTLESKVDVPGNLPKGIYIIYLVSKNKTLSNKLMITK